MIDIDITELTTGIFIAIGVVVVSGLAYLIKKGAISELVSQSKNTNDTTLEDRLCTEIEELKKKNNDMDCKLSKHLDESKIDHLVLMSIYKKTFPDDPLNLF